MSKIHVLTETDLAEIDTALEELKGEFDASLVATKEYIISRIKNAGVQK